MLTLLLCEVDVNLGGCAALGLFRLKRDPYGIVCWRKAPLRGIRTRLKASPEDSLVRHVLSTLVRMELGFRILVGVPSLHVHDIVERDVDLIVSI